jgi:hypothetical protein
VRRALLAALLLAAPGCATLRFWLDPPPRLAACPGPIPGLDALPPGDLVWHDRVRYRGSDGAVDAGFALVAEKRGERLVLVGLDRFGGRAFSVTQAASVIEADARMGRLLAVPPETVLRDWHALRAAGAEQLRLARPECGYEANFVTESRHAIRGGDVLQDVKKSDAPHR